MARKKQLTTDPATGRALPDGVAYRGPQQYRARILINGKSHSKTFRTAVQAGRWIREQRVDSDRGVFIDRSESERNTLGMVLERYRLEVSPEKRGADREDNMLSVIIRHDPIANVRLSALGSKDVAGFRRRMTDAGYAPATVVRRLNLLATVINHARREWGFGMAENPARAALVARPKGADRKRDRRLVPAEKKLGSATGEPDQGEEARLFSQLRREKYHHFLVPLTRLAIETAARQGELCALCWDDIDLERRVMTVRGIGGDGSKNGEIRRVPLSTAACDAIRTIPRALRSKRCFPVDQNTLKVAFGRAVKRAKIADLTFHDLRHEGTSRLAKVYANPLELMRITGHKTLSMLARYYHADAEELAQRLA
jgi:integrase